MKILKTRCRCRKVHTYESANHEHIVCDKCNAIIALNNIEYAKLENNKLICFCGNAEDKETCTSIGDLICSWVDEFKRCECGRVIDVETLEIVKQNKGHFRSHNFNLF